jgi:hypothetical protein
VAVIAGITGATPAVAAFPDAATPVPAGWTGPQFKLSQAYPTALPAAGARPWLAFDFKNPAQAPQYMKAILDYCRQGNTSGDPSTHFGSVANNPVRKWYHAPWLHAGSAGREFIHGMTRERPSRPGELGPAQTQQFDNWAVGVYNPRGGYTIGRVWKDPARPDPSKAKFPLHTVSCKLLFTTAPVAQAPFLAGSLEWQADINRATGSGPRPTLRLLQLDIAVRDARANSTTGWVFGTFQYEKAASTSSDWWEHMVPVGLMWGNDAASLVAGVRAKEQWLNDARGQKLHVGYKDLILNGPIDNPRASCTACHGLAQVNRVPNPTPRLPGIPANTSSSAVVLERYFRNIKSGEAYSPDYASLDYSLQLQLGIRNAIASGQASLAPDPNRAAHAPVRSTVFIGRDAD